MNCTVNGTVPEVTFDMNDATGTAGAPVTGLVRITPETRTRNIQNTGFDLMLIRPMLFFPGML